MKTSLLSICIYIISSYASAQVSRNFNKIKKPKFEMGSGFAYFKIANYPGSKNSSYKFIPFPVVIYRGDKVRADEDGTRARFFNNKYIELGLSAGFNFPIKTSENNIREGMPDTEALIGLGPGLLFKILKNNNQKLTAGVGLRINYEGGKFPNFTEKGWILEPNIRYWYKPSAESLFTIYSGISLSVADKKYNSFYYGIENNYKTVTRDSYSAKAGLVDLAYSLAFNYDYSEKASLFLGVVYSNLTTASNKFSPLVEDEHNISIGLGMTWLFVESKEHVK